MNKSVHTLPFVQLGFTWMDECPHTLTDVQRSGIMRHHVALNSMTVGRLGVVLASMGITGDNAEWARIKAENINHQPMREREQVLEFGSLAQFKKIQKESEKGRESHTGEYGRNMWLCVTQWIAFIHALPALRFDAQFEVAKGADAGQRRRMSYSTDREDYVTVALGTICGEEGISPQKGNVLSLEQLINPQEWGGDRWYYEITGKELVS